MKNILLIAPTFVELVSKVKVLPKGNEDVSIDSTTMHISGSGYHMRSIFQDLDFPLQCISPIGEGVYADAIVEAYAKRNIHDLYKIDGINGCQYTLIDRNNASSTFVMPGAEYEYDRNFMEDIWIDDIDSVIVYGEMLCGDVDSVADLIETLEDIQKPIIFVPNGKSEEIGNEVMDSMLSFHPLLCVTDTEAYYMSDEYSGELRDTTNRLFEKNQNSTFVIQQGEGIYVKEKNDEYFVPCKDNIVLDTFIALFSIGRLCRIDMRNTIMFACSYANDSTYKIDSIKQRLTQLIRIK